MEKQLANGVVVHYLDESKRLAGDRWLVRLRCQATIPLQAWMREAMSDGDPETDFCRRELGDTLTYEAVLERNFIDETKRAAVSQDLVTGFESSALAYLAREDFVRQLFVSRQAELRRHFARLAWSQAGEGEGAGAEAPEPEDFSACFR